MSEIIITMPEVFSVEEAGLFRENILEYFNDGTNRFLLDFSYCSFIDSTGLGVIVSTYKKCLESGGQIKLKALTPNVLKVFELTRLDHIFEIVA
ncbi:STAS domain-containing protein [Paenibacillus donghaensis]|uniref:Anti-sigma factor antagonist n=1 Tax=Paenibacillus donghaensis TaxID=414771 RepID=A0A2Z2KR05_9BACL|nr:STAS domain-containing protein [Paenibacillus donghaensis]ASA22801.1 anti-anti-sigma factor [Paenibacillus donghaensis]